MKNAGLRAMGANKVGSYEMDPMRSPYRLVGRHDSNPYASKNLRMMTMDRNSNSALDGYNSLAAAPDVPYNRRNMSTMDNR